jgi:hypothetical protein
MNILPINVKRLIQEYSKPVTRPDWRALHKMTNYNLYNSINTSIYIHNVDLVIIVLNNMRTNVWRDMFTYVEVFGLEKTCEYYNILKEDLMKMDGMQEAIVLHTRRSEMCRMKRPYGFI